MGFAKKKGRTAQKLRSEGERPLPTIAPLCSSTSHILTITSSVLHWVNTTRGEGETITKRIHTKQSIKILSHVLQYRGSASATQILLFPVFLFFLLFFKPFSVQNAAVQACVGMAVASSGPTAQQTRAHTATGPYPSPFPPAPTHHTQTLLVSQLCFKKTVF